MYFEDTWPVSAIIQKHRIIREVSQAELAEKLRIPAQNLAAFESGKRLPKEETREDIAHILNTDPVEMSRITLSADDEFRLLCKLLVKYADSIKQNSKGGVTVNLPATFQSFAEKYNSFRDKITEIAKTEGHSSQAAAQHFQSLCYGHFHLQDICSGSIFEDALLELSFWIDSWPSFDLYYQHKKGGKKKGSKKELAIQLHEKFSAKLSEYKKFCIHISTSLPYAGEIYKDITSSLKARSGEETLSFLEKKYKVTKQRVVKHFIDYKHFHIPLAEKIREEINSVKKTMTTEELTEYISDEFSISIEDAFDWVDGYYD